MKNSLFTDPINTIKVVEQEEMMSETTVINIRPGPKLSAMLEILSELKREPVSKILFEEIPKELEAALMGYSKSHEIICDVITGLIDDRNKRHKEGTITSLIIEPDSVLSKIEKKEMLSLFSPLQKDMNNLFTSKK